jgi:DNA-binding CsgD family transcriptional regulator
MIRFTHPLLASVLYEDLGEERQSVHGRIAVGVEDPLLRARHLALSKDGPDADAAGVLDAAAGLAADRGVSAVAAELAEQALRLTPEDAPGARHRRALVAARAHQAAGEWVRARTIATDVLAEPDAVPLRADLLVLLAELESVDRSAVLLEEALREAGSRPALQGAIQCRLAWARRFQDRGIEHARAALELAEELDDDALRAQASAVNAILGWFAGEPESSADLLALVRDFPGAVGGEQLVQEATLALANTFAPASRRDEARALLEREHREWKERDEPRAARALWGLAWVEFWAGRLEHAAEYAARELADEQFGLRPPQHLAVMGLAAAWSGDLASALDRLAGADRRAAELGWGEPSVRWWTSDHAELLLEAGRTDDAVRLLDLWEEDATRVGREWVLPHVTRCRGLVAAARGDVEPALALLVQAVDGHEAVGDPFGRARALLALGVVRRRARQKRPAREPVEAARDAFESIGAAGWAEKARGELARLGGRRREEGVTAAERRVAVLVAEGRTNKEIASALFLSERTVASHLTRVYAKLGVRSRTELARRLHAEEPEQPSKVQTF